MDAAIPAAMFFALNLPPGSEIMVPRYTFFASVVPMRVFGLVPVFVDVNPRTLNFDVDDAKPPADQEHQGGLAGPLDGPPLRDGRHQRVCGRARPGGPGGCGHSPGVPQGQAGGHQGPDVDLRLPGDQADPGHGRGMGMYQNREDYERATTFGHSATSPRAFPRTALPASSRVRPQLQVPDEPDGRGPRPGPLRKLKARNEEGVAQVRKLNDRITQLPGLVGPHVRPDMSRLYYSSNILFLDEAKAGFTRAALIKRPGRG